MQQYTDIAKSFAAAYTGYLPMQTLQVRLSSAIAKAISTVVVLAQRTFPVVHLRTCAYPFAYNENSRVAVCLGMKDEKERTREMQEEKTLAALSVGEYATVTAVRHEGSMHRRLLDLGFLFGTPVCCVGKSPLGDPKAYLIRGTVIALRGTDAARIFCEKKK